MASLSFSEPIEKGNSSSVDIFMHMVIYSSSLRVWGVF